MNQAWGLPCRVKFSWCTLPSLKVYLSNWDTWQPIFEPEHARNLGVTFSPSKVHPRVLVVRGTFEFFHEIFMRIVRVSYGISVLRVGLLQVTVSHLSEKFVHVPSLLKLVRPRFWLCRQGAEVEYGPVGSKSVFFNIDCRIWACPFTIKTILRLLQRLSFPNFSKFSNSQNSQTPFSSLFPCHWSFMFPFSDQSSSRNTL